MTSMTRCIRRPTFLACLSAGLLISMFLLSTNLVRRGLRDSTGTQPGCSTIRPSLSREVQADPGRVGVDSSPTRALPVLRILVLTYNRDQSLSRCLASLNDAVYDDYLRVVVEINIDRAKDGSVHNATETAARNFRFRHGLVTVNVHPQHVGVVGQWLRTWRVPGENDTQEIAAFVEDDITLSPYFARWLRRVHDQYDSYPNINGYALQAETIRHAVKAKPTLLSGPPGQLVFLYPVLGSWGFSPHAGQWRDFVRWYDKVSVQRPVMELNIPGLLPSIWYKQLRKQGRADTMWTMWHIYHAYQNKLYTLYPSLHDKKALAFNWKEAGMHYSKAARGKGLRSNLLSTWREEDIRLPEDLMILDAKGDTTGEKLSPTGIVH